MPYSPAHRTVRDQRSRELEGERQLEDRQHEPGEAFHGLDIERLLQRQSLVQTELTAQRHADHRRDHHVPETPELNQYKDNQLSEDGEIIRSVDDDEAGDTDRGGRREERIQKSDRIARSGNRQAQQTHA